MIAEQERSEANRRQALLKTTMLQDKQLIELKTTSTTRIPINKKFN